MTRVNCLTEAQELRADYYQRKGLTLSEIATELSIDRERVVNSLYWDVLLRRRAA